MLLVSNSYSLDTPGPENKIRIYELDNVLTRWCIIKLGSVLQPTENEKGIAQSI
jgi:hypothetical protein